MHAQKERNLYWDEGENESESESVVDIFEPTFPSEFYILLNSLKGERSVPLKFVPCSRIPL